jgi:hypothetical protein
MTQKILLLSLMGLALLVSACNINTPAPTPTVQPLLTESPTATVSPTPSQTATSEITLTPTQVVSIATPLPTAVSALPTIPPTAVVTEGPYVYVIREGETLGFILQQQPWGYPPFDPAIINAVVQLNGMVNGDLLPPPGTELLIPRRTPTPIPEGADLTATSDANLGLGQRIGNITLAEGASSGCHTVVEGETILSISSDYNTTLETLSQLNQNLNWFGCQFNEYNGGPGCGPFITIGQCVNVPLPTSTPVPTATLSGNETATPTPTFEPALGVFPPNGAIAPAATFELQWVSVGELKQGQVYLVEIQDTTSGTQSLEVTRNTSFMLPESLIPTDGQTHQIQWRVSVALRDANGQYTYVGGIGAWRTFQWQSR